MNELYTTKIHTNGNSLAVRIPAAIAAGCDLRRGDRVVFFNCGHRTFAVRALSDEEIRKLKEFET